jgi:large subunit ribosomal protein L15
MDLSTVCKKGIKYRERRRVGRGPGSGMGKTATRGHKGAGARSGWRRKLGFEGGQMPLYRRVPKRGFTNARFRTEYTIVNVDKLASFADGDVVDLAEILKRGLVSMHTPLLKVLGDGALSQKLTVRAHKFSASAKRKIEEAGGKVELLDAGGETGGESS